jgi:uncharacterized Ntn-hydrolase superfamily protein
MKHVFSLIILIFVDVFHLASAQDTFSIVAADSTTREVGSAGASCVNLFQTGFDDDSFLGDLLPDTGAINTQAFYLPANQDAARARMRAGDTPTQIINWLAKNDAQNNSSIRQYGIVGFTGMNVSAAGFTGINTNTYKNHITGNIDGVYYSIQGNILLGQQILDSMEANFRNSSSPDLACRLMAALQGANVVGADTRCTEDGTSSLFAFLKVAQPSDAYGSPSFSISVRTRNNTGIEPIDSLQVIFNAQHSCNLSSIDKIREEKKLTLFPNPANEEITIKVDASLIGSQYIISDQSGKHVMIGTLNGETKNIDVRLLGPGIYLLQVGSNNRERFIKN